ncbi:GNAT family N-acetyltransferase [Sediminispirochaeta bajacaliforniensis]|uniref:GNAT family N-acetyltransferase n=1 Tax=Sediminispirochaeta bajacaliforniensis TaxID=148 RepID=UPI0003758928|nr:GNAT family N-acetyltransferase [Sediminispirochaeta bajacaliforniensis]
MNELVSIEISDPNDPDAHHCLSQYYKELAELFTIGFDPSVSSTMEPDEMRLPHGMLLVARRNGQAVGCGAIRFLPDYGEIKRMWVDHSARGLGIASRILDRLEMAAGERGLRQFRLDTNALLKAASTMYERRGYRPIPRYNDNSYADRWYQKDVGSP